ncbi:MAG TPA: hemerythrin domain-containing protein [Thermoanaerobaculia bacterium]
MRELHDFLTGDHARLDALLRASIERGDAEAYDAFRRGLLRHIAIEERVLFPLLRARRGTTELDQQLHRDHAALAALLVPPPTRVELSQIAAILEPHNALEENDGGLYDLVEELAAGDLAAFMARVHAMPEVPVMPNVDNDVVRMSIERLVREALASRHA